MYTIQIENIRSRIIPKLDIGIVGQISEECSYQTMGAEFSGAFQSGYWDGTKKLFNARLQNFPTGLLSRVRKILQNNNIPYQVEDLRRPLIKREIPWFNPTWPLREYQQEAVDLVLQYTRGTIKAGTGAGKTLILGGIIAKSGNNTLVITHTTVVFEQTIRHFEKWFCGQKKGFKIGRIGAGKCDIQPITVALLPSLTESILPSNVKGTRKKSQKVRVVREHLRDYIKNIPSILIDEAHHVPVSTLQVVMLAAENAILRVGVSATPWREDLQDILIEAMTGRQLADFPASYLIKRGYLAKPYIHLKKFRHKPQPRSLKYSELYEQEIAEHDGRNEFICDLAKPHINQNESVLIAVTRINHGINIENKLKPLYGDKVRFVNGKNKPEELYQALLDIESKKLLCVIATTVYKEGADIPSLDVLINAKAQDSTVDALQTIGRALRKGGNKETVTIYDICDEGCRWLGTHSTSRIDIYKTEQEFKLIYDPLRSSTVVF
jgi:superfamily II DNA or RNA helicase